MELEKAVEILNQHRHRGFADWEIRSIQEEQWVVGDDESYGHETNPNQFEVFEAVAIAQAYEHNHE